jgi:hypothetical protein
VSDHYIMTNSNIRIDKDLKKKAIFKATRIRGAQDVIVSPEIQSEMDKIGKVLDDKSC